MKLCRINILLVLAIAVISLYGYHRVGGAVHPENEDEPSGISFVEVTNSPVPLETQLRVIHPAEGEVLNIDADGKIPILADVQNFELGKPTNALMPRCSQGADTGRGGKQQIYVTIDDDPGYLIELPCTALRLENRMPGMHIMRVYLLRSWHECLKELPGPAEGRLFCIRTFYVDAKTGYSSVNASLPLLTCNAPVDKERGWYDVDSLILDFNLMFKELNDGYQVAVTLQDAAGNELKAATLTKWAPYCIQGLARPDPKTRVRYTLNLQLLDLQGNPVPNGLGDMNSIERIFEVGDWPPDP